MHIFYKLDSFVLTLFQNFSHFIQRNLSIDNFGIGKFLIIIELVVSFVEIQTKSSSMKFEFLFLQIVLSGFFLMIIQSTETNCELDKFKKNSFNEGSLIKLLRWFLMGSLLFQTVSLFIETPKTKFEFIYSVVIYTDNLILILILWFVSCLPLPMENSEEIKSE